MTVHAVLQRRYGTPDVLELGELGELTPGPADVVVAVAASAITQGDRRFRAADFPTGMGLLGRLVSGLIRPRHVVPGTTFSGRIVAVGARVTRYTVGQDVFGLVPGGAHAERLVVAEGAAMAPMPAGVTFAAAASAPYGAGTALHFLEAMAQVQPGERVAVLGASGGVGRHAVTLAKHFGAHVTAVCSPAHFDRVGELGADAFVDRRTADYAALGERFDVVFDCADASSFGHARPALTNTGRFVTLYLGLGVMLAALWSRLRGGGPRAHFGVALPSAGDVARLADLLAAGAIRPVIAGQFPLGRVADAHRTLEAGARGEVVLTPVTTLRRAA